MTKKKDGDRVIRGDHEVGYGRPPKSGQIKPGEVRNPWGKTGKSVDALDAFEKARRRLSRMTIDGETTMVPSDEAFWLSQMSRSLGGDKAAARNVANEYGARRRLAPQAPTAEELAREAAELEERERLAARLVQLLEDKAEEKREGCVEIRYGPDGRPIVNDQNNAASSPSTGALDQPVKEPGE